MTSRSATPAQTSPFRDELRHLYRTLAPRTIGCLHAGDLFDVPLDEFLRGQSRVWLVDWDPRRMRQSVANSLVQEEAVGHSCLACDFPGAGQKICTSFVPEPPETARVCDNFVLVEGFPPRCARYSAGAVPQKLAADGRLGRAACFASHIEALVAGASTPKEALAEAARECHRCAAMDSRLEIDTGSLDLLVSVLVCERIMDEPWAFFSELMTRRFGPWRGASTRAAVAALQAALFHMQLEAHIKELHRLVDKQRGRVYFAVEALAARADESWELAPAAPLIFELLARHFFFDLESLPPASFLRRIGAGDGPPRIVQATLLAPRKTRRASEQLWATAFEPEGGDP